MAQQPDIQAILAALGMRNLPFVRNEVSNLNNVAAQRNGTTPTQPPPGQVPPGAHMPAYPGAIPQPNPLPPAFQLPQPTNAGSLDLSAIRPVNTGSVSLNDALAKARSFAAEKGISYDTNRNSGGKQLFKPLHLFQTNPVSDSRDGRSYRHSRSHSRSPPRRETYNPYRDERRDDRRGGYGRERSRSPARGSRSAYSPQPGRNYGRDRSPRRDDDSEVISIDSNLVGLVIGRQGENLRRVEQETSARIQFITPPDHPGPQRQCRISGTIRARNDAKREIFRIIEENNAAHRDSNRGASNGNRQPPAQQQGTKLPSQPVLREGENSMQIMVPDRTVGLIIGRGGETIRDLQERSGCHINIVGANKSMNGLRPVNLIGSVQAASKAKDLIMEIVESDTRGPQGQNETAAALPPSHGTRTNNQDVQGKISETIKVPSDAVGMIIGKGGETIKEMQNITDCKINVSQASGLGADIEREIGLVGSHQAIEAAKKAIWEKVDMVVSKYCFQLHHVANSFQREKSSGGHGGGGGGGGGGGRRQDGSNDRFGQQSYGQQSQYGQSYNQPYGKQQQQPASTASATDPADPYAPYGGYQNYVALWYAAVANGSKPPGQDGPPAPGA
jgi:far upstream element-binding protein